MLALAPLARAGVIEDVVIDAKSGVSGAGRAATDKTHFVTVDENVNAYGVPRHRHTPEIEQELAALGRRVKVTFTPHLLPLDQGELVSCYVTLNDSGGRRRPRGDLLGCLRRRAVRRDRRRPPGVRDVRETNICRISVHEDERTGRVIVFAAIDNLWKGAASQAVQNLNLMFGLPEGEGICVSAGRSSARDGCDRPEHVTERRGGLPQGFRAAGVAAGIKPSGAPDVGLLVSSARARRAPRASRAGASSARRCCSAASADTLTGSAPSSSTRATRTPRPAAAASTTRPRCRAPRRSPAASREGAVAVASTGVIGVPLPMDGSIGGIVAAGHALARRR